MGTKRYTHGKRLVGPASKQMSLLLCKLKSPPSIKRKLFIILLVSGLLFLSYNYDAIWWLSLTLFTPYLLLLNDKKLSYLQIARWSILAGTIYYGAILSWYWEALPLDWLNISNPTSSYLLTFLAWLTSSFVFSLGFAFFALSYYGLRTRTALDILLAPSLWIISEYARAYLFSLIVAGPTSLIGPHWSLGFLGYILAGSKTLLPLASIGGIYLLSFTIICLNSLILHLCLKQHSLSSKVNAILATTLGFSILLLCSDRTHATDSRDLNVGLVHTNYSSSASISAEIARERFNSYLSFLADAASRPNLDLLIFPEDDRFFVRAAKYKWDVKTELSNQNDLTILSSNYSYEKIASKDTTQKYTTFHAYNTQLQTTQRSKKMLLMPQGEYLPFIVSYPAKLLGFNNWLESISDTRNYSRGDSAISIQTSKALLGALFCSEIMSPILYRDLVSNGAEILINASSHGTFHGSSVLYNQVMKMAKVRATETNRYFLHAGNLVPSFVIDNKATIRLSSGWQDHKVIYSNAKILRNKTIYVQFGDLLMIILCSASILLSIGHNILNARGKKSIST